MDTTLLWPEKRLLNAVGIAMNVSIVAGIVFAHTLFLPIMANDLLASVSTPVIDTGQITRQIMSEASNEVRSRNFDERVKQRYPKAVITDLDRGVKHIKLTRYYDGKPVRINIVEVNRKVAQDYTLSPQLASDTLQNRKTITTIARKTNSIAALNGTFFKPQTGVPLGTLMINGKMYTGPIYDRVALGIFEDGYDIARVQMNATLKAGKEKIKVDNINQPRMLATYTLAYTSDWGKFAPPSPKYGAQIQITDGYVTAATTSTLEIPENGYVIVAPSSVLTNVKIGDKAELDIRTNPEWKNVKHIISGGPYLVKNNEVYVDMTAEKLGAIGGKNPRSAIGYTKEGDLILVAVDGREGSSVGMTLMQLANFMKSLNCENAINLDGGGSTVMYVNGKIVNNPQQKGGIPLSNAIVLSKKG